MDKKNEELELLKLQNEMLKQQLELNNNKKGSNGGLIFIIVLLIAIIVVGIIFFFNSNDSENDNYQQNNINNNSNNTQEKTCVKWENTYNFDYCKYSPGSYGCEATGQKCVEWK